MSYKIEVRPYDPTWPAKFEAEAALLRDIFGIELVAVHHIGSTSIPGIHAKPIIDILLEVRDIERIDSYNAQMEAHGFVPRGEYGLPRRRYFPRDINGRRTTHVHTWQSGDSAIERHLIFCDYMRAHPEAAADYGKIKVALAAQFPDDRQGYVGGKHAFVQAMERKALAWHNKITTKRLVLLPLTKDQLQLLVENRPQLEQEMDASICPDILAPPVRQAVSIKLTRMAAAEPTKHPWFTYWLILSDVKPAHNIAEAPAEIPVGCGLIGFKGYPNKDHAVEIGYGIDPVFRGQGYATEAVSALVQWALQQPACDTVTAWTDNDNLASQHVLNKSGFQLVKKTATKLHWETLGVHA